MRAMELEAADDACAGDSRCDDAGVAGDASISGMLPREPDCNIDIDEAGRVVGMF